MPPIIDFHAHIFPASLERFLPESSKGKIAGWRRRARALMRPFSSSMHKTQPLFRHLPEGARRNLDAITGLAPIPGLLFESTASDLKDAMNEAGVDYALIIAHPKMIPNELVLEAAADNPRMIPVVNVPAGTVRPSQTLKKFHKNGAKVLKIHPAADGEGPGCSRYKSLLKTAADLGMPVILHTGCVHSSFLYKDPEMGRVEKFEPWFKQYPKTRFVLAHMNFHDPQQALDLALEHENLFVDTSWQPAEIIGEATRRIGAERVLFGTDWPLVGNNLSVGLKRIQDCIEIGLITEAQAELIRGVNAMKLLGMAREEKAGDAT